MATIAATGTATPPHRLDQDEATAHAERLLPSAAGGLLQVFRNARVRQRALVRPVPWYLEPHGFRERNEVFAAAALELGEAAADAALGRAGLARGDVDAVLFVSTTGVATPSIDARLADRMGLRADVLRLPVWGLGCAGGVAGLARAGELADATGRRVLLVAMEACSLAFPGGLGGASAAGVDKKNLVAASLFGDGCAAAVVVPGTARGLRIRAARSHLFPASRHVMGWDVHDDRFDVVLSPEIPDIVRSSFGGLAASFLPARPDHWILHPGGAKVVDALRESLGLGTEDLQATERVLREHGNMSSPTVLFVLHDAWETIREGETAFLAALGPGFAAEMLLAEAAEAPP